jgi:hypothetical protein
MKTNFIVSLVGILCILTNQVSSIIITIPSNEEIPDEFKYNEHVIIGDSTFIFADQAKNEVINNVAMRKIPGVQISDDSEDAVYAMALEMIILEMIILEMIMLYINGVLIELINQIYHWIVDYIILNIPGKE